MSLHNTEKDLLRVFGQARPIALFPSKESSNVLENADTLSMEIYTDESRTSSPIVIQGQKKGFSPAVYFSIPESVYNTKGEYYFLIKMTSGTESRYLNDELRRISYK